MFIQRSSSTRILIPSYSHLWLNFGVGIFREQLVGLVLCGARAPLPSFISLSLNHKGMGLWIPL
jgi:hypothetical protein